MEKNKEYFIKKITDIYEGKHIPELKHTVTGWDFGPEYIMKYYDMLADEQKIIFKEAVKDLFIAGGKEWQWALLYVCEKLKITEIIPIMLEYGKTFVDNDFKFDYEKRNPFQFSPVDIVNFLKRVGIYDAQAREFVRRAESSDNYNKRGSWA